MKLTLIHEYDLDVVNVFISLSSFMMVFIFKYKFIVCLVGVIKMVIDLKYRLK